MLADSTHAEMPYSQVAQVANFALTAFSWKFARTSYEGDMKHKREGPGYYSRPYSRRVL
jgi:hypothetical protein